MNVLMAIFRLQEQHLHDDEIRTAVMNWSIEKDNPIVKQQIADRHLTLGGVFSCGHRRIFESRVLHSLDPAVLRLRR